MGQDFLWVVRWWLTLWIVGLAGWPLARKIFADFSDQGYMLAKIVGLAGISYLILVGGSIKIIPFNLVSVVMAGGGLAIGGYLWQKKSGEEVKTTNWKLIAIEETVFFLLLVLWAYIKAHEPQINGLEKFMDFGFTRSILRGQYFPPQDMWFAGGSINYYYFGHLMMAVLTRLSGLPLTVTFNLMLAALFAMTASLSFVIGRKLLQAVPGYRQIIGAVIIAFLVTLSGNMQTIYAFTKGYAGENPPKFWQIWSDFTNIQKIKEGWRAYWYPNATRFIPFTIHEFPGYSFVVSDIHGHVLSIPLVLLAIAFLTQLTHEKQKKWWFGAYGIVTGWAFMTNVLDGPIYLGLLALTLLVIKIKAGWHRNMGEYVQAMAITIVAAGLTIVPFMIHFKSFVSGVAVNCPPAALAETKIGPLLFETADKCQKSPLWMLAVLWGFFAYCATWLAVLKTSEKVGKVKRLLLVWAVFGLLMIVFAEFFYFKDIYPQHFRSNTMFKLGYQVFILMSMLSGFTVTLVLGAKASWKKSLFLAGVLPMLFLVSIYPNFAVRSYFEELKYYRGLYGLNWMQTRYEADLAAINWINTNIPDGQQPVVLEAVGDSYTEYARISTFTGLPTVAGWIVHEWLWRGSYDPIAARAEEVRQVYEATNVNLAKAIIDKYSVEYIVVGGLERTKYPLLNELLIRELASVVFSQGALTLYKVN